MGPRGGWFFYLVFPTGRPKLMERAAYLWPALCSLPPAQTQGGLLETWDRNTPLKKGRIHRNQLRPNLCYAVSDRYVLWCITLFLLHCDIFVMYMDFVCLSDTKRTYAYPMSHSPFISHRLYTVCFLQVAKPAPKRYLSLGELHE